MTLPNLNYLAYKGWKFKLSIAGSTPDIVLCNWKNPKKVVITENGNFEAIVDIPNGRLLKNLDSFTLKIMVHGTYCLVKFDYNSIHRDHYVVSSFAKDNTQLFFGIKFSGNSAQLFYQTNYAGSENYVPDENKPILFNMN